MDATAETKGGRTGWGASRVCGMAAAVLAAYLFITTRSTLWDADEARFSRATVEMVESGNYLYPTFNGRLRPDKPILIYWLMSVPVRLLGPTELACRFFAPIGTAAVCLLTFFIGRRLFSPATGRLAAILLASTPIMMIVGTAATTDAVLLACIVSAIACFTLSLRAGVRAWHVALMALALGAALLTKGPVGLAIPLLTVLGMLLLGRRGVLPLGARYLPWLAAAVVAGAALFIAWGIPANLATGGEFLRRGVGFHVVKRSVEPLQHHGGNFLLYLPYYIPVILLGFVPWTLFLPGAVSALLGGRLGGKPGRAFLLGWILPTLVLMTLVSTKLPHYILPIWPALALATAATLERAKQNALSPRDGVWLRRGVWFFAPLTVGVALFFLIAPPFLPVPGLWPPCIIVGLITLVTTAMALVEHRAGQMQSSLRTLLIGTLLMYFALVVAVLPVVERAKVIPPLARQINARVPRDVPVAIHKLKQATLNFYIGRPIEYLDTEDQVVGWVRQAGPGVLVMSRDKLDEIERKRGRLEVAEVARAAGLDYSRGRWLELVALSRPGTPRIPN